MRRTGPFIALSLCVSTSVQPTFAAAPAQAQPIAALLRAATEEGLDPQQYRAGDTAALAAYARDLALGRARLRALDSDVALPPPRFDPQAVVKTALKDGTVGRLPALLAPPYRDYAVLKAGLARYRAIAAAGGWPQLTPEARDYAVGPQSALVRQRLAFEDSDLAADPHADLNAALKRFQARHGLVVDGILGPATLAELNVTAAARAQTIVANMERWRWLPRDMEPDRIVVNAAAADLFLFRDDRVVLASRAVVGRVRNPTPILRAEAVAITVNPLWTVPASIAAREILPRLRRNPAYLASQDMVLLNGPPGDPFGLRVNWRAVPRGTFPYRLVQNPGAHNALGRLKVELPNHFAVYLHDTPMRDAFARQDRHLSHGCVRVEKIVPLALQMLAGGPDMARTIESAIGSGETATLPLSGPLPVYLLYWTAFAEPDGTIAFRKDVYGRDARILAALNSPGLRETRLAAGCRSG